MIFTSIWTTKKHDFTISIRSIILASRRNRKMKYDANKQSDKAVVLISAVRFRMIPC
jgi:hypothetical protein